MSKTEGKRIIIDFTLPLNGNVTGNEDAFTISGKEFLYVDGPDNNGKLIDKEYTVESVERYGIVPQWQMNGIKKLSCEEVEASSVNQTPFGTPISHNDYSSTYAKTKAFDSDTSSTWVGIGIIGGWIGLDFGIDKKKVNIIKIYEGEGRIDEFIVEASDDFSSWTTLTTNNSTITTWETFNFTNETEYRYYRLRCTTKQSTSNNIAMHELQLWHEVDYSKTYDVERVYKFDTFGIVGEKRIKWTETKPTNTSILIEFKEIDTWAEVYISDLINVESGSQIRATLATTDDSITPTLSSLYLENLTEPSDIIRLLIDDTTTFNSVVGNITVAYNQVLGDLSGEGGAVKSFEETFTPIGLISTPNPATTDFIIVKIGGEVQLKRIEFIESYNKEYIEASVDGLIEFIHIDDLNP